MRAVVKTLLARLPLQVAIILPFALQVAVAVAVVAYLSYRNGQGAVYTMARKLQGELAARILHEIKDTVAKPHILNQLNANALLQGDIDLATGQGTHIFWQQMKIFPATNFVYCATEAEGIFLGVGRSLGGTGRALQIQEASPRTGRYMHFYDITSAGRRDRLSVVGDKTYDPRLRPWYIQTKAQGRPNWSAIYPDFETRLPTITANAPVFDPATGQLLGVCATDIILSEELNDFLQSLTISQSGLAFLVDAEGTLLATSTPEPIFVEGGDDPQLLSVEESANPLIRQVAQELQTFVPPGQTSLAGAIWPDRLVLTLEHERYLVQINPFTDPLGLDWTLVVVIPEADFMADINDQNQLTLMLYLLALALTGLSGLMVARWVVQPLNELSQSAEDITQGNWDHVLEMDRSDAIGDLSRSFATMAHQLRDSLTRLEQRVEERNLELTQLNQELQRLAHSDGLTQTANRRYFDAYLEQEWHRLSREQQPLSLIICDADSFKPYNDTYGHQAGDECLKQLAQVLQQAAQRPADLVARYGGEEFAIILPYTDTRGAIAVAKQIRRRLEDLAIPHRASSTHPWVTMSMGLATGIPQPQRFPSALIAAADQALYRAKTSGRDAYHVAEDWVIFLPEKQSQPRPDD